MRVVSKSLSQAVAEIVRRVSEGEIAFWRNGTELYVFTKDIFDGENYLYTEYMILTLPSGFQPSERFFEEYNEYYHKTIFYKEVAETELDYVTNYLANELKIPHIEKEVKTMNIEKIKLFLRILRETMSLSELSEKTGLSKSELSRLSNGLREPKLSTLEKLRKADPELFSRLFEMGTRK